MVIEFSVAKASFIKDKDLMQRRESSRFFVFPSHEEAANHNNKNLREANKMHPVVKLMAKEKGIHSSSVDTNQAGGLINTPYLCKGAKVMLTANLNVKQGLFNGATGHVVDTI